MVGEIGFGSESGAVERPWGRFVSIEKKAGYQVKRLTLGVGKSISLQKHLHRSEHWVIVSGVAKVTLDNDEVVLRKGESTYVGVGVVHRLENLGKIPLEIIEVQLGEYLGEDDIERLGSTSGHDSGEPDFGRVKERGNVKSQINVDEQRFDEVDLGSEEFCIGPECGKNL
jgi:mannose-6-phosphate isomerase-like protein (cupin superfamily)